MLGIYENAPKKLVHLPPKSCHNFTVVQGRVQLEYSSHVVTVGSVMQLRCVLKNKDLKSKIRRINLKLTLLYQLK